MSEDRETYDPNLDPDGGQEIAVGGNAVNKAIGRMIKDGRCNKEEGNLVWWFFQFARDRALSNRQAGEVINRDGSTIQRLFSGNYNASITNIADDILIVKREADAQARQDAIGFVETSIWHKINTVCQSAHNDSMPAFITGESQLGKTFAALEYQRRNNHGTTRYIRMPSAPVFGQFVQALAAVYNVSPQYSISRIRLKILEAMRGRGLLIVDEVHQAMVTCTAYTSIRIIEFLRECYDLSGVGMVLIGTNVLRHELEHGANAGVFEQFSRRGLIKLSLPSKIPMSDIRAVSTHFKLPDPNGEILDAIRDMLKTSGMGMYVKYLAAAQRYATKRGEPFAWSHFAAVYNGISQLSTQE